MGEFSEQLIDWQHKHGRHDLPWQNTCDPYRIWLSEIMLQQTQVNTVIPYYQRFLRRFPDLHALSNAPINDVLELWAGLGYYARARNLHRCAQAIVSDYQGVFPTSAETIATLPGIGRSTAAAISAFAFGQRAAILDGNVKRVLTRCFGIKGIPGSSETEKTLWKLAESLLPHKDIERYTQGLMDLGASVCTRSKPRCPSCPMQEICIACFDGRQTELPLAKQKKVRPEREVTLMLLTDGKHVLLERRPLAGIWGGLLTLPEGEQSDAAQCAHQHGTRLLKVEQLNQIKHSFTHFRLLIQPLLCTVTPTGKSLNEPGWQWLSFDEIDNAALAAPIKRLLLDLARNEEDG